MRWLLIIGGIVLLLLGAVWLLQGINVLPGSFMSGQAFWPAMGVILIVCGAIAEYFAFRRKPANPQA